MRKLWSTGPLLLMLFSLTAVAAEQPQTYDQADLSVTAGREVENDTLVIVMYAQREGNNTSQLATEVNSLIGNAIKQAKTVSAIKVQTLEYNTTPVYRKQTLEGWRIRQSIRLESKDSAALSDLVGKLQKNLAVGSISYTVSPEQRRSVEERLITEAIAAFKQRSQLVSREMGRSGYRLVRMQVNTSGIAPRPQLMRAMVMEGAAAPAPALEAGTQQLQVHVSGTIEMTP